MLVSSFHPRALQTIGWKSRGSPFAYFSQLSHVFLLFCQVKLRASGRNFLGQQLPTLLDDTCCVRLYTLLHVAARTQSWKPVKLLSQHLPTFLLFRDRRSVAQQFWIRLRSSSNIVEATHSHYTLSPKSYTSYPSHDALQVPTLLGVVASVCTPLPKRTQQLPTYPPDLLFVDAYPPLRSLSYDPLPLQNLVSHNFFSQWQ